jgi:hypothetical protein
MNIQLFYFIKIAQSAIVAHIYKNTGMPDGENEHDFKLYITGQDDINVDPCQELSFSNGQTDGSSY